MNAVAHSAVPSIRPMDLNDLEAVTALEKDTYPYPWTAGIFQDCLRVGYSCHVVEMEHRLAGYGILSLGGGEAHVLNLCIHADYRRGGIGRALLNHLLDIAIVQGAGTAFLEVRPSNAAALALYESAGFKRVGVRKDYYQAPEGREDAVVLAKNL